MSAEREGAGARAGRKTYRYETDDVTVEYDVKRCIHAEECVHGLPDVFDPQARPWIRPERAGVEALAEVVSRCPTGALHLRRADGTALEAAPDANTARIDPDGPVFLRGRLRVSLPDGPSFEETRMALCRCGLSSDKPFCDGSHVEGGFRNDGRILENRLRASEAEDAPLEVSFAQNGPVLLSGPVRIENPGGDPLRGSGGALCRCGHSAAKPFCDGTHKTIGFEAD